MSLKTAEKLEWKRSKKEDCDWTEGKLEFWQEELKDVVSEFLPIGETVEVKRGNGVWEVEVTGHSFGSHAGYFRGKSRNGKIHKFHFSDVIVE